MGFEVCLDKTLSYRRLCFECSTAAKVGIRSCPTKLDILLHNAAIFSVYFLKKCGQIAKILVKMINLAGCSQQEKCHSHSPGC
jgi:hypothetical protein